MRVKPQRIRDPLHNLIEFGTTDFEQALWRVVQSKPFQRLRRIKQLGFSEIVYPGATHTRFSHSLGVYHIAKSLISVIEKNSNPQNSDPKAQHALAAALVHDVGHGPFSHAFEEAGKKLDLPMASHERVSEDIILNTEIGTILDEFGGEGFKNNVAGVIKAGPARKYGAVVSSQFDADRLDYLQRDRMMAGTQLSGIDFRWLVANLEVADIPWGDEEGQKGTRQSFVLGAKALYAAEAYVLSLFQLYPTLYFHKATRCAEKFFTTLMVRILTRVRDGSIDFIGLPKGHPLVVFGENHNDLDNVLDLDDAVISGSLPMLEKSKDDVVSNFASRLRWRNLYKSIEFDKNMICHDMDDKEYLTTVEGLKSRADAWSDEKSKDGIPRILTDDISRDPYKKFDEEKGPLNQMLIVDIDGKPVDLAVKSEVVRSMNKHKCLRFYISSDDDEAKKFVNDLLEGVRK